MRVSLGRGIFIFDKVSPGSGTLPAGKAVHAPGQFPAKAGQRSLQLRHESISEYMLDVVRSLVYVGRRYIGMLQEVYLPEPVVTGNAHRRGTAFLAEQPGTFREAIDKAFPCEYPKPALKLASGPAAN